MFELQIVTQTLWLLIPAYVPNSAAVLVGGGKTIDSNKKFIDGKRIFGAGKTWRGFFGGSLVGIFVGIIQNLLSISLNNEYLPSFGNNWLICIYVLSILAFGAMLGDLFGSFIKRRLSAKNGEEVFLIDSLFFILIALLLLLLFANKWFTRHFYSPFAILTIIIATPILHRSANIIGYKVGKKKAPW